MFVIYVFLIQQREGNVFCIRFFLLVANSHLLLQDLKVMAEAGPLASLVAIESAAQLHHQDATKLLINCVTHVMLVSAAKPPGG